MPSDEMVEKVARAICAAQGYDPHKKWETYTTEARAALAAAEAGEPVASWECFRDEAFFDMWCVRPKGERRFGHSFHVTTEEEAEGLVTLLSASPPSEASRDERAAIRDKTDAEQVIDAIWFYLGQENHFDENRARLERIAAALHERWAT